MYEIWILSKLLKEVWQVHEEIYQEFQPPESPIPPSPNLNVLDDNLL